MKKGILRQILGGICMATMVGSLAACGGTNDADIAKISVGNKVAALSVHDPAIVADGGNYYIFGSHMAAAKSDNLIDWKIIAEGVNKKNPVLGSLFDDMKTFDYTGKFTDGGYAVWAPDVIYNKNLGKWVMYYSSSHDFNTSVLCMATADDVAGPYTYEETLLYSGFTSQTVDKTNFYDICGKDADVSEYLNKGAYNYFKYPNCIDANIFEDKNGKMWFCYGSWSGGIWLFEVDETTGRLIHPEKTDKDNDVDRYFGKHLIGGLHNSCEGPYIFYCPETDYYYLTVSYGGLTREGGYQIRVFRSEEVDGPYVDTKGESLQMAASHSGYGLKMMGNYSFPSLKTAYMAPGHNSILVNNDGKMYVIYHQRFDSGNEYHEPRVHQIFMTKSGWPVAAPFATMGETLSTDGYKESDIAGKWYILSHGTDISKAINAAKETELSKGEMSGGYTGTYRLESGSVYMTVQVGDVKYDGVIIEMDDEAGNRVMAFMGVSETNETLWAVKYLK